MWRLLDQYLVVYPTILATALMVSLPGKAAEASLGAPPKATSAQTELLQQPNGYSSGKGISIAQVNRIQPNSAERNVSPAPHLEVNSQGFQSPDLAAPPQAEWQFLPEASARLFPETAPLPETLLRALNHESGSFFRNNSIRSQAESIFGFGSIGQASFPEKEIVRDAELVEILYKDLLEQQVSSDPVLRTRDLDNPFDSSLLNNPSYLRDAPPE